MANKLTQSLMYVAKTATQINQGIYFNEEFDPSKQAGLELIDHMVFTSSGESAVIAHVDATANSNNEEFCMLSFRGRDYSMEKYSNVFTGACGLVSLTLPIVRDNCWKAILEEMDGDMKDIRDSTFSTSVGDEDGIYMCENLNDELAAKFEVFDVDGPNGLQDGIEICLDNCKSNTGSECPMYFTGHSQGGVYAQMAAVRFKKFLEDRNGNDPYLLTFGVPPAFEKGKPCTNALPPSDNIFNFVNIGEYDREKAAVFDAAVSVGLDKNAEHTRAGYLVLMNGIIGSISVDPKPHLAGKYESYNDLSYSDKTKKRANLHKVATYKERVGSIVEATSGQPGQDGFDWGTCSRSVQCNQIDDPDVRCKAHELTTRECTKHCFFACWTTCKTIRYTRYGCM